ncbi:hypothetical protein ABZ502_17285 [Streptomyces abikoensis]|uniref:hypothetical protein n=1 Tax=Streptomyces abikoensis TaxID=97398 RepID=UPI0033EAD34C
MADTHTHVEIDAEAAALARHAAEDREIPVEQYLGELVRADNVVAARERFMEGAREILQNYGDIIDRAVGEEAA